MIRDERKIQMDKLSLQKIRIMELGRKTEIMDTDERFGEQQRMSTMQALNKGNAEAYERKNK